MQILQWNVGKRRSSQLSLLNDEETNNFDLLLIREPYRFTPTVVPTHTYWEAVLPTTFTRTARQPYNFRSIIYINKRTRGRRIPMDSSDLVAIRLTSNGTAMLVIAVYIEQGQTA